MNRLK